MRLADLMTPDVITIGADASLKEAARRMIEAGISGLPVTDDDGHLIGVITEADFVKTESDRRSAKRARLLRWFTGDHTAFEEERRVGDVMTSDVITLEGDADHAEAARVMRNAGIKRIPIVDGSGTLVGLVSRSDILRAFVRPDAEIISEIRDHLMRKILWVDPAHVHVRCEDGNVVLTGRLETRSDTQLLTELARRIDGIVSVKSDLTWEIDNTKLEMTSPPPVGPNW